MRGNLFKFVKMRSDRTMSIRRREVREEKRGKEQSVQLMREERTAYENIWHREIPKAMLDWV